MSKQTPRSAPNRRRGRVATTTAVSHGDRDPLSTVYLHGGHIFTSAEPAVVTTIVGSCVTVCLWDRETGIGGINHYLLPQSNGTRPSVGRLGALAIPRLIQDLVNLGSSTENLVAKVFGGASVLGSRKSGKNHVGTQNVEMALSSLAAQGIPVLARDVGGSRGRKVVFDTQDGSVLIRRL